MPKVSIIMRSMNDIEFIEKTLGMIVKQNFKDFELINVDSGSSDGTYEIIKDYNPDKSYRIKPADYVPGKVLNDAVKKCSGEIIVFNNSDCIPGNKYWLENLVQPLSGHENIVAVYGNQIPRPNAYPLVVKDNIRAFGDGEIASGWFHFFSLASSAIKREFLKKYSFDSDLQYSEDTEWSYRMKKIGFRIRYASDAVVEHSHNYTLKEVWNRFYNEGIAERKIYGESRSFTADFLGIWLAETSRDLAYLTSKRQFSSIPHGLLYRFIQQYSLYQGNRHEK
jgi:GT2 family glycosyltransferase